MSLNLVPHSIWLSLVTADLEARSRTISVWNLLRNWNNSQTRLCWKGIIVAKHDNSDNILTHDNRDKNLTLLHSERPKLYMYFGLSECKDYVRR